MIPAGQIIDHLKTLSNPVNVAGMARLAVLARRSSPRKKVIDEAVLISFLPVIARKAVDERNYVKKGVNWALRQIGKCNHNLRSLAIETARQISQMDSKAARWVAKDALRELGKIDLA